MPIGTFVSHNKHLPEGENIFLHCQTALRHVSYINIGYQLTLAINILPISVCSVCGWEASEGSQPFVSAPLTPTGWLAPAQRGVGSGKKRLHPQVNSGVGGNYITSCGEKRGKGHFSLNQCQLQLCKHIHDVNSFFPEKVTHMTYYQDLLNCPQVCNHSQRGCANLL